MKIYAGFVWYESAIPCGLQMRSSRKPHRSCKKGANEWHEALAIVDTRDRLVGLLGINLLPGKLGMR